MTARKTSGYVVERRIGPHTVGKPPSWGVYRLMMGGAGMSLESKWPDEESAQRELDRLEGKPTPARTP